jgi:hypothetical protein
MRKIISPGILASICLAISTSNLAFADNLAQVKKSIEAMYLQKNISTEKKDLTGMMSIYAPGATIKYPNGKVLDRGELEKQLVALLPLIKSVVSHDVVKTISLKGTTALVQSKRSSTTVTEEPDTHKQDHVVHTAETEDTWVKIGDKWLLKQVRVIGSHSTVNGKTMTSSQ